MGEEEEMDIGTYEACTVPQALGQLKHRDEQALSGPVGFPSPCRRWTHPQLILLTQTMVGSG